jgi:hypothetical protein
MSCPQRAANANPSDVRAPASAARTSDCSTRVLAATPLLSPRVRSVSALIGASRAARSGSGAASAPGGPEAATKGDKTAPTPDVEDGIAVAAVMGAITAGIAAVPASFPCRGCGTAVVPGRAATVVRDSVAATAAPRLGPAIGVAGSFASGSRAAPDTAAVDGDADATAVGDAGSAAPPPAAAPAARMRLRNSLLRLAAASPPPPCITVAESAPHFVDGVRSGASWPGVSAPGVAPPMRGDDSPPPRTTVRRAEPPTGCPMSAQALRGMPSRARASTTSRHWSCFKSRWPLRNSRNKVTPSSGVARRARRQRISVRKCFRASFGRP